MEEHEIKTKNEFNVLFFSAVDVRVLIYCLIILL